MKIKFLYLNLTNYPYVEEYFDQMAQEGYILEKILMQNIYIFKKTNLKNIKYSISPFQYETSFDMASPEEIQEFNDACENIGWNYIEKTSNLFIYYRVLSDIDDSESLEDIHTDSEVEYSIIESLIKKQRNFHYIFIVLLLFLSFIQISNIFTSSHILVDPLSQLSAALILLSSALTIGELINLNKFLKLNKEQETHDEIIFLDVNQKRYAIIIGLDILIFIAFVLDLIYLGALLSNGFILIGLIPVAVGSLIGFLYRKYIKSKKIPKSKKILSFVLTIVLASGLAFGLFLFSVNTMAISRNKKVEKYSTINRKVSILAPVSYTIVDNSYEDFNMIEYTRFLNEDLSKMFFKRKLREIEKDIKNRNIPYINYLLEERDSLPPSRLEGLNLSPEEFEEYKKLDIEDAKELIMDNLLENSLEEIDKATFKIDFDEAYFTSVFKDEIILRINKEVYVFSGINLDEINDIDSNLLDFIDSL